MRNFINAAAEFAIDILSALGIDITPAAGRNLLAESSSSGWRPDRATRNLLARSLSVSMQDAFDLFDTILRFSREGEALLVDLSKQFKSAAGSAFTSLRSVLSGFLTAAKPVKAVLDAVSPWVVKLTSSADSSDSLLRYLSLGNVVKAAADNIKPLMDYFIGSWSFMREQISKVLPLLNEISGFVDIFYRKGLLTVKQWLNIDQQLLDQAFSYLAQFSYSKTSAELAAWTSLPWCSATICLRQESRSEGFFDSVLYKLRYLHWWDSSTPPLFSYDIASGPDVLSKRYHWTLAGLYEWYRPRGVDFWDQAYMVTGLQYTAPLKPNETAHPSLLVFYARGSDDVYKLIELWEDESTPFTGTCGGVALARDIVYVSDDSVVGGVSSGLLLGFDRADIQRQLDAGRAPGRVFVTSRYGKRIKLDLPFSTSSLYYDGDIKNPRLWVTELFRPGSFDQDEVAVKSNARFGQTFPVSFGASAGWSMGGSPSDLNEFNRAKLVGYPCDYFTGLLQGWYLAASQGDDRLIWHNVEVNIGA